MFRREFTVSTEHACFSETEITSKLC